MENLSVIVTLVLGVAFGTGVGYYMRKLWAIRRKDTIEARIETLINEAKAKQKQFLLEANDKALKIAENAKNDARQIQQEVAHSQKVLEKRQALYDQKILDIESKDKQIVEKIEKINKIKEEINKIRDSEFQKLEKIAALTKDEAKNILIQRAEQEAKEDLEKRAKEMISLAVQRCASSHAAEITTSTLSLPSDEMKGRIIGKEGRNIKAIEQITGVEII